MHAYRSVCDVNPVEGNANILSIVYPSLSIPPESTIHSEKWQKMRYLQNCISRSNSSINCVEMRLCYPKRSKKCDIHPFYIAEIDS